ncbi:hypothetical protein FHX34_106121 [Actinoplanes teichomyceticus]|uniref:Uncharacterized protein n=1 Tax=Actinoplanes teichomyceticus TaxID=1867 RepID=A0A561VIF0_ACTTI|nr:hypothetical protein FHX34_106121 [Actinoplanes teichomyceticus]
MHIGGRMSHMRAMSLVTAGGNRSGIPLAAEKPGPIGWFVGAARTGT